VLIYSFFDDPVFWHPFYVTQPSQSCFPTTEKLACLTVSEERVCNTYATLIPRTQFHREQKLRTERAHLQKQEPWSKYSAVRFCTISLKV
jgi:hypothetical protein